MGFIMKAIFAVALLVLFLCMIGEVEAGRAEYVSLSYTYDTQTGNSALPWTENFQVPQFNTNLGTLTGITLTVNAQFTGEVDIYNTTGSAQPFANAYSIEPVTVTLPSTLGQISVTPQAASGISGTANVGFNAFPNAQATFSQYMPINNFSPFEGSGTAVFTIAASGGPYGIFGGSSVPGVFFSGQIASSGDAAVTVTYDYASTPVPGAVWLFGSGLAGLFAIKRVTGRGARVKKAPYPGSGL
jgi:hypothetical protein